jgi:magnesium transporter
MAPEGRVCLLRLPTGELRELDASQLEQMDRLPGGDGHLAWLDLRDPDAADLDMLRRKLDLHPLAVEDLERRRQRAKVDTYPGHYVIVAYELRSTGAGDGATDGPPDAPGRSPADATGAQGLTEDARPFELAEMHLIVGAGYLVSVRWGPSPTVDEVRRRFRQRADRRPASAGGLLYDLLDALTDGYFPVLDRLSDRIDALQDEIIAGRGGSGALAGLLSLKRMLLDIRRVVAPTRDVANTLLRREVEIVDEELVPYYQDLYDHLVRVLDTVDLDREMIAAALDANLSVTSNNLNVVVKRLTAFTVILMLPTLIAGIYGMNFRAMPELTWPWGYPLALLLMASVMGGAFAFFKARDWF